MILDPAGVWVTVGSDQVEPIILNLVVRASEAMPLGGKLVVATRCWQLAGPHRHSDGVVPAGRWATVRVADTGTTPAGGTDLAKVVALVNRAGGHLVVEAGNPVGAAVVVCLPSNETEFRSALVAENTPAVLVVDGDPWMQTTTAHVLRRAGYGVLQADHAAGALDLLRGVTGSCIRVMLVDVDLAGGDPGALARAARQLKTDLQVIYVGDARAGSSDDLLTKPYTSEELHRAVARRLGAPAAR